MSIRRLKVFRKTEDLLYKVYPALVNYPKHEKFALVNDIRVTFFKLLSFISQANSVKSKRKIYLQEADGHLQVLKIQIKLSKQRRYISVGFFNEVDLRLSEINKLLSGYIRSAK